MLVSALVQLPLPIVSAWIIDHVFQRRDFQHLGIALSVMFGTGMVLLMARFAQTYFSALFSERAKAECVSALVNKTLEMSASSFHQRPPGYLLARVKEDVGAIDALLNTLAVTIGDTTTLIFAVALMFLLNFRMAVLASFMVPLYAIALRFFNRGLRNKVYDASEKNALVIQELQESLTAHDLIKSFGAEQFHYHRFGQKLNSLVDARIAMATLSAWARTSTGIVSVLVPGTLLWLGVYEFSKGRLSLGALFAFNTYLAYILGSANGLVTMNFSYQALQVAVSRMEEILNEVDDIPTPDDVVEIVVPRGGVRYANVCFSYTGTELAVSDITFEVLPGEHVALVGQSGAGKSTIVGLLLRLYRVNEGEIQLDGVDVRRVAPGQLRTIISVVPQETVLITGTVVDNIRYNSVATYEQILWAAKMANADEFIRQLPGGYQALLGERGFNLSTGQKQRVAIARALARNPKLLILDEASSGLDSRSEQLIRDAVLRLHGRMTIITIAHRLNTVRSADRIFFLKVGRLVGAGTHEDLYAACEDYARLYDLQFGSQDLAKGNQTLSVATK